MTRGRAFSSGKGWTSFDLSRSHHNLTGMSHFTSNEKNHGDLSSLFRSELPHVRRGKSKGIYLGVGPEQNYTLIAGSKSAYAVLFDYDPKINLLHYIHRSAFIHSRTPEAYIRFFSPEQCERSKQRVLRDFERYVTRHKLLDSGQIARHKRALAEVWDSANNSLWARARMNHVGHEGATGSMEGSYLHDPGKYRHIRKMYKKGRIKIVFGSLTDGKFFDRVNRLAKQVDQKINVVYASNAYDYIGPNRGDLTKIFSNLSPEVAGRGLLLTSTRTWTTARSVGGFGVAATEPSAWAYPYLGLGSLRTE